MMAGRTPHLDKLAAEGMIFTDYYGEASCTAGRREDLRHRGGAAFSLGEFHDAFLSEGAIPVPLIRRAMLGPSSGPAL